MDDLNDPRISAYRAQRRLLLPAPPGFRRKRSKVERKQEARAEARIARWHLVGLTDAAVVVMACLLGAAVLVLVVVAMTTMSHR